MNKKIEYLLPILLITTMAICSIFAIVDEAKYILESHGIISEETVDSSKDLNNIKNEVDESISVTTIAYHENSNTNSEGEIDESDFENLYPFRYERYETEEKTDIENRYLYYLNVINYELSLFESNLTLFDEFKDIGSSFRKSFVSGAPYVSSKVVEIEDGYFIRPVGDKYSRSDLQDTVNRVRGFNEYLNNLGIPMVYVNVPLEQSEDDEKNYISGFGYSYVNQNNDLFTTMLKEEDISLINLKEYYCNLTDDYHALYYNTDHHHKVSTGFEVSKIISDYISENYGLDISKEYLDEDLYETIVYKDAMFGSEGQTVGSNYASRENFEFLNPTFETDIKLTNIDIGADKEGSFLETILNTDKLEEYSKNNGGYAYECLIGGNRPLTKIKNLNSENKTRILILKDSFALAVAPYLSLTVDEVDLIDTRPNAGNFNGSVRTYIENNKPNIVLLIYGGSCNSSYFD
jgi:hypothetical protein